jgi:hypothetical protein
VGIAVIAAKRVRERRWAQRTSGVRYAPVPVVNSMQLAGDAESDDPLRDVDLCRIIFVIVVDLFRPRAALEAEILVLRQQITVLRRGKPSRLSFLTVDKVVLGWVCHLLPKARDAGSVAPCRLPIVLALEVQASSGPSSGAN